MEAKKKILNLEEENKKIENLAQSLDEVTNDVVKYENEHMSLLKAQNKILKQYAVQLKTSDKSTHSALVQFEKKMHAVDVEIQTTESTLLNIYKKGFSVFNELRSVENRLYKAVVETLQERVRKLEEQAKAFQDVSSNETQKFVIEEETATDRSDNVQQ